MKRIINLFKIAKGYLWTFPIMAIIILFLRYTFSFVPLFTQYIITALENYTHNASIYANDVALPNFILNILSQGQTIIQVGLILALTLAAWQTIRFTIGFLEQIFRANIQEQITYRLRVKLYGHIQDLPFKYHTNVDTGDLIQRVTSDVELTTRVIITRTLDMVSLLGSVLAGAIQLYFLSPLLMWLGLAAIPITAVASIIYFNKINVLFKKVEEKESAMMVVIQENVASSKVVKAFANENFEIQKMEEKNSQHAQASIKTDSVIAWFWGGMDILMMIQFSAVLIVGILLAQNGTMDSGMVVAAIGLLGMLIWPVRGLGRLINDFGRALVASDRINEILNLETEYIHEGVLEPVIHGKIEFKGVSFQFPDASEPSLSNLNFTIEPHQTVALVGKTGSGKSTIINVLLRNYEYEGSILVDGVELKEIKKHHIRSNIGAVLQDPFLFSKTVYENITITNKKATTEQVQLAAREAAIEKDIHTFQKGYDTTVGEKGATLSGGQKQRVAISRILLDPRPILVFDDALSALDNLTDSAIRKALKQKNTPTTNIIITHRITTAKECDFIIVLEGKTIANIGTHEQLASIPGLYKELWDIQGKLEVEFNELLKAGEKHA